MNNLREALEWIKVSDKIPPKNRLVSIYDPDLGIEAVGFLNDWETFYYFILDDHTMEGPWKTHDVTHWMPLPPPPDDWKLDDTWENPFKNEHGN